MKNFSKFLMPKIVGLKERSTADPNESDLQVDTEDNEEGSSGSSMLLILEKEMKVASLFRKVFSRQILEATECLSLAENKFFKLQIF